MLSEAGPGEHGIPNSLFPRRPGIDRKTIRAYQKRLTPAAASNSPGVATGAASVSTCAHEPYRPWIETQLCPRRNAVAIYQDLVDQHGFAGTYNSVKRLVRQLRSGEQSNSTGCRSCPARRCRSTTGKGALTRVSTPIQI